jgi:hypothetical protein
MNSLVCRARRLPALLLGLAVLTAAGCQSRQMAPPAVQPPPRSEPARPAPHPAPPSERPAPPAVAAAPPASPAPAQPPVPPPTATTPPPAAPPAAASAEPVPEYVEVLELIDPGGATRVRAQTDPPARLVVETENVQRLRLRRARLSLARDRSVALKLDGQMFEWTRATPIVEFARSANGTWAVASDR